MHVFGKHNAEIDAGGGVGGVGNFSPGDAAKGGGGIGGQEMPDSGLGGEAGGHEAGAAADFEDRRAGGVAMAAEEGDEIGAFLENELGCPLVRGAVGVVFLFGVLEGPGGGNVVDSIL